MRYLIYTRYFNLGVKLLGIGLFFVCGFLAIDLANELYRGNYDIVFDGVPESSPALKIAAAVVFGLISLAGLLVVRAKPFRLDRPR